MKNSWQTFDLCPQGADFGVPLIPHIFDSAFKLCAILLQRLVSLQMEQTALVSLPSSIMGSGAIYIWFVI
jgi:hypothetical protein